MSDDPLIDASIAASAWRELAESPDGLIGQLADAARRHRVMVSVTVSPYEPDVDEE